MTKKGIYAFIDASNIIYGAKDYGWRVDFKKLAKYLKTRYGCSKLLYYGGIDPKNSKQIAFCNKLKEFGYTLKLVPVKVFKDGSRKGDVDSRMTFEMMLESKNFKSAVILTGDGDYFWVLEYLHKNKTKLSLISFPGATAKELKVLFGKNFANLDNLRKILEFKQ